MAIDKLIAEGKLEENPIIEPIAAVSVGILNNEVLVDLDIIDSIFENGMYLTITVEIIDEETKEIKMVLKEYTFRNIEDNNA